MAKVTMSQKIVKFTPELAELIKRGEKTTTFRLFDDKDLSKGDEIVLATREGDKSTAFSKAVITEVILRTVETLQPDDYDGHEHVTNPLETYRGYYGDKVTLKTKVKVIKFKVQEIFPVL